jgi:hypothetical protein
MKMRRFEKGGFATSEDSEANADRLGDFIATLDRGPVAAPDNLKEISMQAQGRSARTKPSIVTKEELAKSGMSLRDYMNKQQGLTRRQDKVDPDLRNREADAAFARERMKAVAEPTADEIANKQRKEKLNRLKTASAGAESKMRQANALRMSRADFVGDTGMAKGGSVKGYASGGSVSASRRGDGIAQRGKTRGKMC